MEYPAGIIKYSNRIFVGGIAFKTTPNELKEFFSNYGAVKHCKITRDKMGISRGYGFVTFFREEDATKVLKMGTIFFREKRLHVGEAYRKVSSQRSWTQQAASVPAVGYLPVDARPQYHSQSQLQAHAQPQYWYYVPRQSPVHYYYINPQVN